MADKTALAESSQALFCAIADFLGDRKSEKVLDIKKYLTIYDGKTDDGEYIFKKIKFNKNKVTYE